MIEHRGGPATGPGGEVIDFSIENKGERGVVPTLRENLALGIGKAHRQIVYSHYDYTNRRENKGSTGRVA